MQLSRPIHRYSNKTIIERREKVIILMTKGMKGYQIAKELQVDPATISRDIHYLSIESNKNLEFLVKKALPFLYRSSIEGIRNVLYECWNIYQSENTSINYINKLNSLKLAKECHESLFKLVMEGPTLTYLKELEERLDKIGNNKKENT
jgi:hypothetical protein